MTRLHNFGAGPGVLPLEVIKSCKSNLEELGSSGLGLMETSHRSPVFQAIVDEADARLRRLLRIPDEYSVLFLQGGRPFNSTCPRSIFSNRGSMQR